MAPGEKEFDTPDLNRVTSMSYSPKIIGNGYGVTGVHSDQLYSGCTKGVLN